MNRKRGNNASLTRPGVRRQLRRARLALLVCSWVLVAHAFNPQVVFPEAPEKLPAFRYAALARDACLQVAEARRLPFTKGPPVPSIDAPVRLEGALGGVVFRFAHEVAKEPREGPVLDCRLLLALDDLAAVAREQGISELQYNSIYRGRGGRPGWRHPAGVAIDIVAVRSKKHGLLKVEQHFQGEGIGSKTCAGKPLPREERARELRSFVCRVHEAHIFNLLLTPHYDKRHADHFHLEVRRGIKWYLTQ